MKPLNELWDQMAPLQRRKMFKLKNTLTVYKSWAELNDGAKYLLEKLYKLQKTAAINDGRVRRKS